MKEIACLAKIALIPALLVLLVSRSDAQALQNIKSQKELETIIASLDTALFDSYNRCDLVAFSGFFADNLEFYHDKDGVILGKEKLTENISPRDQLRSPTILQIHGIGTSTSPPDCFALKIHARVHGERGEGHVVGARCSPSNQITQYWVQKSTGERFWATLQELKAQ